MSHEYTKFLVWCIWIYSLKPYVERECLLVTATHMHGSAPQWNHVPNIYNLYDVSVFLGGMRFPHSWQR